MTTRAYTGWMIAMLLGCGGSDESGASTSTGADDGSDPSDTTVGDTTAGTSGAGMQWPPGETAGVGEACTWHDECVSWYCRRFSDVPADPEAACADTPTFGTMIVTGTIHDLRSGATVGDVGVRVISAFAAVANPVEADALAETVAGPDGRFEATSTLVNGTPLGIVASVDADGYFLTFTAVAGPVSDESTDYFPGNDIHDLWVVSDTDVTAWSEMLAGDPLLVDFLPLGEKGGAIGIVRDGTTGAPLAGAVVQSEKGVDTAAYIRYLNEDESGFDAEVTGSSGVFVIVNSDLAESFAAFVGDEEIGSAVAGTAAGSILAVAIP